MFTAMRLSPGDENTQEDTEGRTDGGLIFIVTFLSPSSIYINFVVIVVASQGDTKVGD